MKRSTQVAAPLLAAPAADQRHPPGLWMIDQDCAGLGIRVSTAHITGNFRFFVPRYFP